MIISVYSVLVSIIALIVLSIASYTDIRTREVPDWLNFSLIGIGFALSSLFSIVKWDHSYILNSVIGFGIFLVFRIIHSFIYGLSSSRSKKKRRSYFSFTLFVICIY